MSKTIRMYIGTRPNYIKAIPIYAACKKSFSVEVVDTGQHWDHALMKHAWGDLELHIRKLDVQSSNRELLRDVIYNDIIENPDFDYGIVIGDVNSALSAAWAMKMSNKPFAHIEAGLRSGNWCMEEEYNRFVIDHLADINFVTERQALKNAKKADLVGNVLLDNLKEVYDKGLLDISPVRHVDLFATIHRRENINSERKVQSILYMLNEMGKNLNIMVVKHPHFVKLHSDLMTHYDNLIYVDSMDYIEFLKHIYHTQVFITDSGGAACEAFTLGTPCVVYRDSFEHKTCVANNFLVSENPMEIEHFIKLVLDSPEIITKYRSNSLWSDGRASQRIANILADYVY